jgi:lambda repressor-like predicted transcriptional regulator
MSYFEGMAAQLGQRQRVEKMSQRGSMFVTALEKPMDPASIEIFRIMAEVLGQEDRRIWEFTYWEDATREEQKKIRAAQAGTK